MPEPEKINKAALIKLLEASHEIHEKYGLLLAEFDRVLGGGASLATDMKRFEQAWLAVWASRYHGEYVWTRTRDMPQVKRLVRMMTLEELQLRATTYIRNDDAYFVKNRHAFGAFVATINQHAAIVERSTDLELESVPGCLHQPPCGTDAEHTRRRMEEMRYPGRGNADAARAI